MTSITPQEPKFYEVEGWSPMWAEGSPWRDYRLGFGGKWHPHYGGGRGGQFHIELELYVRRNPRPFRGLIGSAPGLLESHPFRQLRAVRTDGAYSFPKDRCYDDDSDYFSDDEDSDDFRRDGNRDALARRAVAHMLWGAIPYGGGRRLSPTGYDSAHGAQNDTGGGPPHGSGTDRMDNNIGGGPPNGTGGGDGRNGRAGHRGGAAPRINAARHNNRTTQHVPRQQSSSRWVTADPSASLRGPYGHNQHSGRAHRLRRVLSAPLQGVLEDFFKRDRLARVNSPVAGSHAPVGSHAVDKNPSKVGSLNTTLPRRHQDTAVEQQQAVSTPHEEMPTDAITTGEGPSRRTKDLKGKMKGLSLDNAAQTPTTKYSFERFPDYNEPEGWQARLSTTTPTSISQQQPISHANARIDGPSSSVSTPTDTFGHGPRRPLGAQGGGSQRKIPSVPHRLEAGPWVTDLHDDNQTDPSTTGSAARPSWRKRAAQSIRRLLPQKKDPGSKSGGGGGVKGLWHSFRNRRRLKQQKARLLAEEIEMWRRRDKKRNQWTTETVRPRANGTTVRPAPPVFVPKHKRARKEAKSPRGQGQGQGQGEPHHHHHRTPHQAAHDFFDEEAGRKKAKWAFETAPLAGAANTVMMAAS